MTDYGYLWMFIGGLTCGYFLDRFRLWLERWAERQAPDFDEGEPVPYDYQPKGYGHG